MESTIFEFGHVHCSKQSLEMANSVDPDETAHYQRLAWIYTVCISICFRLLGWKD